MKTCKLIHARKGSFLLIAGLLKVRYNMYDVRELV